MREERGLVPRSAVDGSKTLDELESMIWCAPTYASYLVTTCHRLRKKPLAAFTSEDLRIMIGQSIGLPYLLPLALDALERDALTQGDFYPGDLLQAVLGVSPDVWDREWEWRDRVLSILASMAEVPKDLTDAVNAFTARCSRFQ
jgi:hypothetical protein